MTAEILKMFKWTPAQLKTARAFLGFPAGRVVTRLSRAGWKNEHVAMTPERDVEAWAERAGSVGLSGA